MKRFSLVLLLCLFATAGYAQTYSFGNVTLVTLSASGQITSTVSTGTAPFVVSSTTNVANLNASSLNGATFAAPGAIGSTTPSTGAFSALSCGVLNTTACVLTGFGSTSGTATITWPAVAGTATNPIAFSNAVTVPLSSTTGYGFAGSTMGLFGQNANTIGLSNSTGAGAFLATTIFNVGIPGTSFNFSVDTATGTSNLNKTSSLSGWGWTASSDASASADTGLSRDSAGVVDVGNGAQGNVTGTIKPGKYATGTNPSCVGTAANPSVASCGSGSAGSFSCATNASTGTCQVNTTAVTANSQIFVQEDDSLGTKLGVTCNTNNVLPATAPLLGARNGGTSFTINLGTFTTNPLCYSYHIIN